MSTVGIVDICASLETDAIIAGAVKMGGGIEIVDLFLLDTFDSVIIHLAENVWIRLSASDSC